MWANSRTGPCSALDGGQEQALISEDGALEPAKGSFSIEPFIRLDGKLLDWSKVAITQSL
jgi:hypothetical protein